jgi:hypothetical protein
MAAILTDFCKKTGIKLKVVNQLYVIGDFMEGMAHQF